jgi:hypothetical protein
MLSWKHLKFHKKNSLIIKILPFKRSVFVVLVRVNSDLHSLALGIVAIMENKRFHSPLDLIRQATINSHDNSIQR